VQPPSPLFTTVLITTIVYTTNALWQTGAVFIAEKLIALVAPHRCLGCGAEGVVVCEECLFVFTPPLPSRCYACQAETRDSRTCSRCRRGSKLKHVWICTSYEGGAKQLVQDFKFERKQAAAQPIVLRMDEVLPFLGEDTIIVHVPTATSRVRLRGYDHAQLLARALTDRRKLTHLSLLTRQGQERQVGASRKQRLTQLDRAFIPIKPHLITGATILLVDDLVTTGATLEAAARCLRQAGAKTVSAVVFAQKQ